MIFTEYIKKNKVTQQAQITSRDLEKNLVSVIIPIRNEELNLEVLLLRIHDSFTVARIPYQIVAVDDYSTDSSYKLLKELAKSYPIKLIKKRGIIGRGSSIVEGLQMAEGDIIAIIDADLAYPPEALPQMVEELKKGDIVIGNRIYVNGERKIKKIFARVSQFIFGNMFFGLNYDVQSGIKVFKRDIVAYLKLNPSQWSFDLEFLLKSAHAGFTIIDFPIKYGSRKKGEDKMNLFQAAVELILLSVKSRLSPFDPVIFDPKTITEREIGWKKSRFKPYTTLHPRNSAIRTITTRQVVTIVAILLVLTVIFLINWKIGLIGFITCLTLLYFTDLLFNLMLILNSLHYDPSIKIESKELEKNRVWPKYTIMCPLYKEWEVVPQFTKAIEALDYPKDKLQVLIVLEEDDKKTQEEIKKMSLPSYFEVLVTPDHQPKTKPKACNYALLKSTGDCIVIYDAEDIPEPLQLKKAVVAFDRVKNEHVVCLQSKLNFYNVHQNLLTRLFTLEYTLWFDLVLTGLHSIGAPLPLGGTSNHFRRENLTLLQGWDPFNVTEDCDLGIRLFKYGYKTMVLDSVTLEEANSSFFGWFPQRTRWIKGYIQTYLVHMRRPHEFITDWSNPHLLTFQLIVGGKVLSMWINPFLWIMTFSYFAFRPIVGPFIETLYLTPIFYLGVLSLIFGNFLYFYYYMIGAANRHQWDLIKYAFVVPFYWLMMSYASWRALYQVIFAPHYWEKTTHGLHLQNLETDKLNVASV